MSKTLPLVSIALLAVAAALPLPGLAAETENDRWNLADLYANADAWKADSAKTEAQAKEFEACKGKLGQSAKRFQACLDLNADIAKRYVRLSTYASQFHDQDTGNSLGQDLNQKAAILGSELDEAVAFLRPEILALGRAKIDKFVKEDKALEIYRHMLDQILRAAPHTLDAEGEGIVAQFGLATDAASSVYDILSNADMPWPTVKLSDGTEIKLDQAAYTKYRASDNREDRKRVFDAFWGQWKNFERTFGVTFYEMLKKDTAYTKVRKYPDSLTRALDGDKLPPAVYDMLIKQTRENLPTLHRYFKIRAKILGINDLHYYDMYPALVKSDLKYPVEEGKQLMLDAVQPLGPDYVATMTEALKHRWMDV